MLQPEHVAVNVPVDVALCFKGPLKSSHSCTSQVSDGGDEDKCICYFVSASRAHSKARTPAHHRSVMVTLMVAMVGTLTVMMTIAFLIFCICTL